MLVDVGVGGGSWAKWRHCRPCHCMCTPTLVCAHAERGQWQGDFSFGFWSLALGEPFSVLGLSLLSADGLALKRWGGPWDGLDTPQPGYQVYMHPGPWEFWEPRPALPSGSLHSH